MVFSQLLSEGLGFIPGKVRPELALLCLCCTAVLGGLYFYQSYQYNQRENQQLKAKLLQSRKRQALLQQFAQPFEKIRRRSATIANARVRWTERLENELSVVRSDKLVFSIDDPELMLTDLAGLENAATARQYPVQITAALADDSQLLTLLHKLSRYHTELMENRGCRISRAVTDSTLQLSCLYAIYDLELQSELQQ